LSDCPKTKTQIDTNATFGINKVDAALISLLVCFWTGTDVIYREALVLSTIGERKEIMLDDAELLDCDNTTVPESTSAQSLILQPIVRLSDREDVGPNACDLGCLGGDGIDCTSRFICDFRLNVDAEAVVLRIQK
jgi:hypothetical protein